MKAIKVKLQETNPDRVDAFEKGAAAFAKKIVANFKDFEFVSVDLSIRETSVNSALAVHWGIYESRWSDCSPQLQGTFSHVASLKGNSHTTMITIGGWYYS